MRVRYFALFWCLGVAAMMEPVVSAQAPTMPGKVGPAEQLALDVLKDIHNRGAELYNRGDSAAAFRLYEGALRTASVFLAARPKIQKLIADGLEEVGKTEGPKIQAFRLHEVIEQVRGELKEILAKPKFDPGSRDGLTPMPETLPLPRQAKPKPLIEKPKLPAEKPKPKPPFSGVVNFLGKPKAGASITIASLDTEVPKTFTAVTAADGGFSFPDRLPKGKYVALIEDPAGKLPARYGSLMTSGLRFELTDEPFRTTWELTE